MVTKEQLSALSKLNSVLPDHIFIAYEGTEVIEICTGPEMAVELINGNLVTSREIEMEKLGLSTDFSPIGLSEESLKKRSNNNNRYSCSYCCRT